MNPSLSAVICGTAVNRGHPHPLPPPQPMTHPPRTTTPLQISTTQAGLLRPLLRVHLQTLRDLLEAQVQALPPGDDTWADTSDEVCQLQNVLQQLEGVR